MNEFPKHIQKAILTYEPATVGGITLYPIRVEEYEDFAIARAAIDFMQQSLPVALLNMPILQAYYRMDRESIRDERYPTGLFSRAVLFLVLALRLGEGLKTEERLRLMRAKTDPRDQMKLKSLVYTPDGEEICEITPAKFQRMRPILAAQNGIRLQPEDANPELVEAEEELRRQNAPELEADIGTLVASVAAISGTEEREIYDWPIAKLLARQKAYQRMMDYVVCGIGEANGTKWKKGNPYPSPFFDRKKEGSAAMIALTDFAGGAALNAVSEGTK